jgi:hypothetical protein
MSYDDGRVALTDDALVIRKYYFPFGDKRLPYGDITNVRRRPLAPLMEKWRIWGSSDFVHWFNYDPGRPRKDTALEITQSGHGARPVITPDNPDEVAAELAAHGVTVTSV